MNKLLIRTGIVVTVIFAPVGLLLAMMVEGWPRYKADLCDFYRQVWSAFRNGGRV